VIAGDVATRNGPSYTKSELVEKVLESLKCDSTMNDEFERQFLDKLGQRLG